MKNIKILFILTLVMSTFFFAKPVPPGGGQPEFYFRLTDNVGSYFKIKAEKYGNSPIYDNDFNYTHDYDFEWDKVDENGNSEYFFSQNPPTENKGFDWRFDGGTNDGRGLLGYGIYQITIQVAQTVIEEGEEAEISDFEDKFTFILNVRSINNVPGGTGSPDMFFELTFNDGVFQSGFVHGYYPPGGSQQNTVINANDEIKIWEINQGWTLDETDFIENVELKNDFSGTVDNDVKVILKEKVEGFPTTSTNYQINYQFTAGEHADFWRGATYKFTVTHEVKSGNKIRHWVEDTWSKIGKEVNLQIVAQQENITAIYRPVYSQININNLEGVSNGGNYDLTWITPDPDIIYNDVQSNSDFYVFKYDQINNERYNISVNQTLSNVLGTNWEFLDWENGSTSLNRNGLQFTMQNQFHANYKGIQRSDNSNAYSNSSQRKFIKVPYTDYLVSTYESMDRIWLEASSDNGNTWEILNNGQPINGSTEAKNPSLAVVGDCKFAVVYQENSNENRIKIKVFETCNPSFNEQFEGVVKTLDGDYDANPVVAVQSVVASSSHLFLIVWKENSFENSGLHYRRLERNSSGTFSFVSYATKISNTDAYSSNPTLAVKQSSSDFHLAWQEEITPWMTVLNYYRIVRTGSNTLSFSNFYTASSGSGYTVNTNPSMVVKSDNSIRLFWVGQPSSGSAASTRVVVRARYSSGSWGGSFGKYGSYVTTVNANIDDAYTNLGYVWVEENGSAVNKFRKTGMSYTGNLGSNGTSLQLSNGSSLNNMYVMSFNNNISPYQFDMSNSLGSLSKSKLTNYLGRQGIVRSGDVEYYCTLSDVSMNDELIEFVPVDDKFNKSKIDTLNSFLSTTEFKVINGSEINFNLSYGFTDSLEVLKQTEKDKQVKFTINLVDSKKGTVISTLDEVVFDKNNHSTKNNKSIKVSSKGIENRKVKLQMVVSTNMKVESTVATIESDKNVLGKQSIQSTKNLVLEVEIITEYSLAQNYPNPFNPTTTISYQLPKDGNVTLKIYDALGKEITTLVNGEKQRGKYSITFDASNLTSGIYFYSLTSGSFKETKKLILIK